MAIPLGAVTKALGSAKGLFSKLGGIASKLPKGMKGKLSSLGSIVKDKAKAEFSNMRKQFSLKSLAKKTMKAGDDMFKQSLKKHGVNVDDIMSTLKKEEIESNARAKERKINSLSASSGLDKSIIKDTYEKVTKENREFSKFKTDKENDKASLLKQLSELQNQKSSLESEIARTNPSYNVLELDKLKADLSLHNDKISNYEVEIKKLESRNDSQAEKTRQTLAQALASEISAKNDIQSKIDAIYLNNAADKDKVEALTRELRKVNEDIATIQARVAVIDAEVASREYQYNNEKDALLTRLNQKDLEVKDLLARKLDELGDKADRNQDSSKVTLDELNKFQKRSLQADAALNKNLTRSTKSLSDSIIEGGSSSQGTASSTQDSTEGLPEENASKAEGREDSGGISGFLGNVLSGLSKVATAFAAVGGFFAAVGPALWDATKAVGEKIGELWTDTKGAISDFASNVADKASDLWNSAKDSIKELSTDALNKTKELWNNAKESIASFGKTVDDLTGGFFSKTGSAIADITKNAVDRTKELWNTATDSISDFASNAAQKASDLWNAGKESIVNFGSDVAEKTKELWNSATDTISEFSNNALEKTKDLWNNAKESMASFGKTVDDLTGGFFSKAAQTLSDIGSDVAAKTKELWSNATSAISDFAENAGEKTKELWENAKGAISDFADNAKEKAGELWQSAKDSMSAFGSKVDELTGGFFSSAAETLSDLGAKASNYVSAVYDSAKAKIDEVADAIGEKVDAATQAVADAYDAAKETLVEAADAVVDAIPDEVKEFASDAADAVTATATVVKDTVVDAAKSAWSGISNFFFPESKVELFNAFKALYEDPNRADAPQEVLDQFGITDAKDNDQWLLKYGDLSLAAENEQKTEDNKSWWQKIKDGASKAYNATKEAVANAGTSIVNFGSDLLYAGKTLSEKVWNGTIGKEEYEAYLAYRDKIMALPKDEAIKVVGQEEYDKLFEDYMRDKNSKYLSTWDNLTGKTIEFGSNISTETSLLNTNDSQLYDKNIETRLQAEVVDRRGNRKVDDRFDSVLTKSHISEYSSGDDYVMRDDFVNKDEGDNYEKFENTNLSAAERLAALDQVIEDANEGKHLPWYERFSNYMESKGEEVGNKYTELSTKPTESTEINIDDYLEQVMPTLLNMNKLEELSDKYGIEYNAFDPLSNLVEVAQALFEDTHKNINSRRMGWMKKSIANKLNPKLDSIRERFESVDDLVAQGYTMHVSNPEISNAEELVDKAKRDADNAARKEQDEREQARYQDLKNTIRNTTTNTKTTVIRDEKVVDNASILSQYQ